MAPTTDVVVEWFDSHCHIQEGFVDREVPDQPNGRPAAGRGGGVVQAAAGTLARAGEAGVTRMVCVGTNAATSRGAVTLARELRGPGSPAAVDGVELWATVGLHPHEASSGVSEVEQVLEGALVEDRVGGEGVVVAVGECGLDYYYEHSDRRDQRDAFAAQIDLARRYDLALVIHSRDAWDDTFDVLAGAGVPERTVFHCFTGGPAEARRCLDTGALLSFSGIATFKSASDVREAAAICPLDRLLVETDSPFLAPVPHRGSVNEPCFVPLVGAVIAEVKGVPVGELASAATANAIDAFDL